MDRLKRARRLTRSAPDCGNPHPQGWISRGQLRRFFEQQRGARKIALRCSSVRVLNEIRNFHGFGVYSRTFRVMAAALRPPD
jgi:hypothetical protein